MKQLRMAGLALGSALAGAALVVALVTGISTPKASAGGAGVTESTVTAFVGAEVPTTLQAVNIASPGLGAWSLNVTYDPSVVTLVDCSPGTGGVCNPHFAADTARVAGANASGLEGDTVLATITFSCDHVGQSPLTITIDTLADATAGAPQDIPNSITNGSVMCQLPSTPTTRPAATATHVAPAPTATAVVAVAVNAGSGPGSNGGTIAIWLVAGLIGAGIAWLSAGAAGAGLAVARSSNGTPRTPNAAASLPSMKPTQHASRPEGRDAPRSSPAPADDIPSFRPARRPPDNE